ncbi:MAG: hypothetical protein F6K16_40715, partial [Symploca sp. SIO2B6]|nr:hypothetical protein [Symploca sp. SIO2B6]
MSSVPSARYTVSDMDWVLEQIRSGKTLTVDCQHRNGLILCKPFHAEFAGPGATVGGIFDLDCQQVLAVGRGLVQLSTSHEENQKAYRIRCLWTRLMRELTQIDSPHQRAKKVLTQFEAYFGKDI